jgi:hypothetical protein
LVSNDVSGGTRTVVLTRALSIASSDYYSFSPASPTVELISAIGSSQVFAYVSPSALVALRSAGVGTV